MSRYRAFIILILDVLTIFLCNFLTMLPYLLGQDIRLLNLVLHIGLLTVCVLLFQVCLKTYDTLWRYAESREYLALLEGMGLGFALYSVVNLLLGTSRIWISSALTGTALALLVMLGYRFVYRSYRRRVTGVGGGPRAYAAIIGAGSAGAALVSEMDDRIYGRYRPYCVIDDAAEKQQKRIHGVPVLGPIDAMEEILADTPVTDIILAIQNLTPERRQEILTSAPARSGASMCSAAPSRGCTRGRATISPPCARWRSRICSAARRYSWKIRASGRSCAARPCS